jgi:hypothetical protein
MGVMAASLVMIHPLVEGLDGWGAAARRSARARTRIMFAKFSQMRRMATPQLEFEALWSRIQKQPPTTKVKVKKIANSQE